jgi:PLP dependent protein
VGLNPAHVADRLAAVRDRLAAACASAGRPAADVRLLAVSKNVDLDLVAAAVAAGQHDLGENRLQDALPRQSDLAARLRAAGLDPGPLRWHFIGHLQSNKAGKAAGAFHLLHGVDSLELAARLDRQAAALGVHQAVLLEVNVAGEAQKYGLAPEDVPAVAVAVAGLPSLDLRGLMAMARFGAPEAEQRRTFAALRELRDRAAAACGRPLPELSMGMSDDFPAAVAEGSTCVRIGTAIFAG